MLVTIIKIGIAIGLFFACISQFTASSMEEMENKIYNDDIN